MSRPTDTPTALAARIRSEARIAGLRGARPTTLDEVEQRRTQLSALVLGLAAMLALVVTATSFWPSLSPSALWVSPTSLRISMLLMVVVLCIYVPHQERHLRRLTRLLVEERAAVASLEEKNRLASELVANVSHELRSPLTAILGSVSGIRRMGPDHQAELLDIIERQSHRLMKMINDLLTVSPKGDDGALPHPIDVADVLRGLAPDLAVAGTPIELAVPDSLEAVSNPTAVEQVVVNLVENAYKYGAPPVCVAAERVGDEAIVSVTDHGPGIPPSERERVFDRFHRLSRGSAGIGLGLSIVRQVVERIGGRVWVDDSAAGGAAFRIALPVPERQPVTT